MIEDCRQTKDPYEITLRKEVSRAFGISRHYCV